MGKRKNRLTANEYISGILSGDIVTLSRAITLVESSLPDDNLLAQQVIEQILPNTGNSIRVGITGVPGVGKSTFIEAMGQQITAQKKKLAVLTIDPSSQRTSGSIMGDKTRMDILSNDPLAYIRPSASGDTLGGVANKTREAMLLCEAAGYEVIFIETVGVGQSETAVKGMVDFFLLLMLAGAGDELQGIKKGIMEMADGIAITKADRENINLAKNARLEYQNALHLFPPTDSGWIPQVLTCSSLEQMGLSEVWSMISKHNNHLKEKSLLEPFRKTQNIDWMHQIIEEQLKRNFYNNDKVKSKISQISEDVENRAISPVNAANELLKDFTKNL
jgi:LAO/AO transport system kinase